MAVVEDLIRAREAYERREWLAAYDGLTDAAPGHLVPEDLVRLATAAYLLGERDDCVASLRRAYHLDIDAGDRLAAARCAFWLAMVLLTGGETVAGSRWVARSHRLLAEVGGDAVERGYLLVHEMYRHVRAGELDPAYRTAERITGYGRRYGEPDLVATGLSSQGRMLLYRGRVPDGLALLDEAMVGVLEGSVSTIFAGNVYCSMIQACQEIADFDRAARWTAALTTWCSGQPDLVAFTGQCAVHRGQIMRAHGAFDEALTEFDLSVRRHLAVGTPRRAGVAMAERGDVLRIRGDLDGAQAAYDRATAYGKEPQPGLALLWLDQGRTTTAVGTVRRLLGEALDPVHRAQLLPAAIEILLAGDRADEAAPSVDELETIATEFGCPAGRARAGHARALFAVRTGDPAAALPAIRGAVSTWERLDARYDTARSRVLLGRVLRALDDEQSAVTELATARRTLAELGATPAEDEAAGLLGPEYPRSLTAREVEILQQLACGRTNAEIAAALLLSEKAIARHLSNILTKLGVPTRTAAAAFAQAHHLA